MPIQHRQLPVTPDGIIDEVSDIDELERRGYDASAFIEDTRNFVASMEYAKKLNNLREIVGVSRGGFFFHTARLPAGLVYLIETIDPDLFRNKERFYRYLDRHPYYKTGYSKQMTSCGGTREAQRPTAGTPAPAPGVHGVALFADGSN